MSDAVRPSLLVVDDDDRFRERLSRAFRDRGFDTREAGDVAGALAGLEDDPPEYAVVDLRLPGGSGLDVVYGLKRADPATNVVVLTGFGSIATALEAVKLGATHYLTKPADVADILDGFARADRDAVAPSDVAYPVPSLSRLEWEHINRVLTDCGGNVSKAARLLGIHRRSLQRKLAKYPLPR